MSLISNSTALGKQAVDKDFSLKANENTEKIIPISQHCADNQQSRATDCFEKVLLN